jgi:hypothetical protein
MPVLSSSDKVIKAEILWVLKYVASGFSFSSSEDIVEILKADGAIQRCVQADAA